MQGLTLLIAVVAFVLAFVLKPAKALLVYCAVLFAYPELLTVPLGTVDFNAPRITILGLMANLVFRSSAWRGLKWNWLDTFVVAAYFLPVLAALKNAPASLVFERQFGGQMLDILFPYFAARMALRSRPDMLLFFKGLVYIGSPLALFAMIEAKTGFNVYSIFYAFYGWGFSDMSLLSDMRLGMYRARGSFGVPILLGLFFSATATMAVGLWREKVWSPTKTGILFLLMIGGLMASLSSAPLFAIFISMSMVIFYRFRRLWPVLVIGLVASMIFVEVYSNRHFYHVLTWFSFSNKTAYYRIHLLEEAFGGGMDGHWMYGYGYVGVGPGNDNTNFHWKHRDFTNLYIAILVRFGLVGVLPYIMMQILYYRKLYVAARSCRSPGQLWLIWCLTAALVGWNISMLTVSAFRQIAVFQYMLIGLCNNLPAIVRAAAPVEGMAPYAQSPRRVFRRPPWRYSHARRFGGHRQLERPGLPQELPDLPEGGYRQA